MGFQLSMITHIIVNPVFMTHYLHFF